MNVCGCGARTFLMPFAVCKAWGRHKRKHSACCLPPRLSLHSPCWRTHSPSRSEAPAGHPTPELISDTAFLESACRSEGSVFRLSRRLNRLTELKNMFYLLGWVQFKNRWEGEMHRAGAGEREPPRPLWGCPPPQQAHLLTSLGMLQIRLSAFQYTGSST